MSEPRHAEIRQRLEKAMPGKPWPPAFEVERVLLAHALEHGESSPWSGYTLPASKFIAHAWQDVKDLLEENAKLREVIRGAVRKCAFCEGRGEHAVGIECVVCADLREALAEGQTETSQ